MSAMMPSLVMPSLVTPPAAASALATGESGSCLTWQGGYQRPGRTLDDLNLERSV